MKTARCIVLAPLLLAIVKAGAFAAEENPYDAVLLDDKYYAYSIVADAESENPTIRVFDLDEGRNRDGTLHPLGPQRLGIARRQGETR